MTTPDTNLVAIIMAGGAGTRFWPLSTSDRPKQFLTLFGSRSLLQQSYDRLLGLVPAERIIVLTNDALVDLTRAQLPDLPSENVIGEPCRRDTAAAVCLGALIAKRRFGERAILTVTADHLIEPLELFERTARSAVNQAVATQALYTFGIRPASAATSYGYLEIGDKTADDEGVAHHRVVRFREKPDLETAQAFVAGDRHLWNSGMFVWTAQAILEELTRHLPDHVARIGRAVESLGGADWRQRLSEAFQDLRRVSIDFGVMEKARDVRCVAAAFMWSDVGGWPAVAEHLPSDEHRNAKRCQLHLLDAHDNLVFCENPEETVILVGVSELIAVRAEGRTLIAHRSRAEDVKKVVERLTTKNGG
jgi:mannose-1-phosphate guanylyltransferase